MRFFSIVFKQTLLFRKYGRSFLHILLFALPILSCASEKEGLTVPLKTTHHTIQLPSGPLSYTAITGLCPLFNDNGDETAEIFFIAYIKHEENENRPITFNFPGGPGGAATIHSICTFGPRRLLTADEGRTILPPYQLIDNPETILEFTDLVFVDPVNCGFSTITDEEELDTFYSVHGDIRALGQFIHTFIDTSKRWNCPIYLSGNSYGTLRSTGLALELLREYDLAVHGLILDGCALDYETLARKRDHALPDCLLIPTCAATAWYHKRLCPEKSIDEVVEEARRFALDEYAPFMLQPTRLNPVEKARFERKLAQITGLQIDTIKHYNCRINETMYTSEFFRSERKVLGGLDTRTSGTIYTIDPFEAHDPSYMGVIGLVPAFNFYLQKELDTHFPFFPYIYSADMIKSWYFSNTNLVHTLRIALTFNPLMKVFIGSGYFDCRTPFAATEYCLDHLDLPPSYQNNFQIEYYEAGHGLIFDAEALKKWKKDLTKFYGY